MRLDRYIAQSRIIEIQSTDLKSALLELLAVATQRLKAPPDIDDVANKLISREKTMTTYLGNGVAMPHIRIPLANRSYVFAVGRVPDGLDFDGLAEYRKVRLLFLLLASENEKNYLNVLASLARLFRDQDLVDNITAAPDTASLRERVNLCFGGLLAKPERRQSRFNRILLREAEKVAREAKCAAILVFGDTFAGGIEGAKGFPNFRTVLVTRAVADRPANSQVESVIEVRSFSKTRLSQARSAILIGLTRGIFKHNDRLCCVGGIPSSNQLDTVMVVDIEREFHSVIDRENDLLPPSVKIEVIERMIAIATELSIEGREGKPVGTLFIIGDTDRVNTMVKPLVLNPFYGYRSEDRNVLNPFMDETIKEFSVIDGGFVIRGNGVIESAGSLIHPPAEFYENLPSGFGTRHSAAAAITKATDSISICISASTGQVTLFRKGVMFPLLENSVGGNG